MDMEKMEKGGDVLGRFVFFFPTGGLSDSRPPDRRSMYRVCDVNNLSINPESIEFMTSVVPTWSQNLSGLLRQ